jgi:26S proteasome regulatory subunit T5
MSSAPPPGDLPSNNEKPPELVESTSNDGPAAMDVSPDAPPEETWDDIPEDIMSLNTEEVMTRTRLIDNDIKEWFYLSLLSR